MKNEKALGTHIFATITESTPKSPPEPSRPRTTYTAPSKSYWAHVGTAQAILEQLPPEISEIPGVRQILSRNAREGGSPGGALPGLTICRAYGKGAAANEHYKLPTSSEREEALDDHITERTRVLLRRKAQRIYKDAEFYRSPRQLTSTDALATKEQGVGMA